LALADIYTNIPAVPQNDEVTDNHLSVRVTIKDHTVRASRGGIDINHLLGFFAWSYQSTCMSAQDSRHSCLMTIKDLLFKCGREF